MNRILLSSISGVLIALLLIAILEFLFLPSLTVQNKSNFNFVLSMTDPPITIEGVSSIYLNYGDILIHKVEDNSWISLNHSGNIELMGLVNSAQFLTSNKLEQGSYNLIRFLNISATVTYYGQNYSAITPSNDLIVNMDPAIYVSNDALSAVLIDLVPRVSLTEGNALNFILIPFAKAYVTNNISDLFIGVSKDKISDLVKNGLKVQLKNRQIEDEIWNSRGEIVISNVSITYNSIDFTIANTGNSSVELKLLLIYSNVLNPSGKGLVVEAFRFMSDGSIIRVPSIGVGDLKQIYQQENGYILQANTSKTFIYQGVLSFTLFVKDNAKRLTKGGTRGFGMDMVFTIVVIGEPLVFAIANFSPR